MVNRLSKHPTSIQAHMSQPWMQLEFAQDVYIAICKDTGETVAKDGIDWLLQQIKKSPANQLMLRNSRLGFQGVIQLSKRLEDSNIPIIDIYDNSIKDLGLLQLIQFASRHPQLKKINIGCNDIYLEGALALAEGLQNNIGLEVVELGIPNGRHFCKSSSKMYANHYNRIQQQGAVAIAQALISNKTLKYLGMGGLQICDKQNIDSGQIIMNKFGQMLAANCTLSGLDLSSNNIGNYGASALFKGLSQNFSLQNLDIDDNNITSQSLPLLAALLRQPFCNILSLSLNNNNLGVPGAKCLAYGISSNKSLQIVSVENCGLGDEGVALLCEILTHPLLETEDNDQKYSDSVKQITGHAAEDQNPDTIFNLLQSVNNDIESNKVGRQIIVVDSQNRVVNTVDLDSSNYKKTVSQIQQNVLEDSCISIQNLQSNSPGTSQRLLKSMTSSVVIDGMEWTGVESLNLASNSFSLKTMRYVSKLLTSPVQIRILNLSNNQLGHQGVMLLSHAIINNQYDLECFLENPKIPHKVENPKFITSQLQQINLSGCGVSDESYIALCFAFSHLQNISVVNLSNNFIAEKGGVQGTSFLLSNKTLTYFNLKNNQVSYTTINLITNVLEKNKQRILQSAPSQLQKANKALLVEAKKLPIALENLEFMMEANRKNEELVYHINKQTDELQENLERAITNVKDQSTAVQEQSGKTEAKIEVINTQTIELEKALENNKQRQYKQYQEETDLLKQLDETLKQKQAEHENLTQNKERICKEMRVQIQQMAQQFNQAVQMEADTKKIIELLSIKYKDVCARVSKNINMVVGPLLFKNALKFDDLQSVLVRMKPIAQREGNTVIPAVTGYNINDLVAAGAAIEKSKSAKKKGKK